MYAKCLITSKENFLYNFFYEFESFSALKEQLLALRLLGQSPCESF